MASALDLPDQRLLWPTISEEVVRSAACRRLGDWSAFLAAPLHDLADEFGKFLYLPVVTLAVGTLLAPLCRGKGVGGTG